MASRELFFLGTGSQVPTRHRNQHGLFIRWDALGFLVDPGEGTQRQLLLAGIAATQITHILITHFHGDHCLGLAAICQRLSLDKVPHPVEILYPASGQEFFERLCHASIYKQQAQLKPRPITWRDTSDPMQLVCDLEEAKLRVFARPLDHRVDCLGYLLREHDGVRMLPDRLADRGVVGPDIKRLMQQGQLNVGQRLVQLEEVSTPRPGQKLAVILDTRVCENAVSLAQDADLVVSEATYTSEHEHEAREYAHMTAAQAAQMAARAGARKLVLTHFSQRYQSAEKHVAEAQAFFPDVQAAEDLTQISLRRSY